MSEKNNHQVPEKDEDGIQLENENQGNAGVEIEPEKELRKKMRAKEMKDENENDLSLFSKDVKDEKETRKSSAWLIVCIFLIVAGIFGTFFAYKKYGSGKRQAEKKDSIVFLEKKEIEETVQEDPDKKEIPVAENADAISDGQKSQKENLTIKILNGGSAPGSAGNIMNFLLTQGYAKVDALNAKTGDHIGAAVYFSDSNFQSEAENIQKLLKEKKIDALLKKADSAEQKSADVVVMLGK